MVEGKRRVFARSARRVTVYVLKIQAGIDRKRDTVIGVVSKPAETSPPPPSVLNAYPETGALT